MLWTIMLAIYGTQREADSQTILVSTASSQHAEAAEVIDSAFQVLSKETGGQAACVPSRF